GYNKAKMGGYSLIMLDIMIPKMDGLQILKKLKEENKLAINGPVVLITNLEQDNIIQEGYKLGASGYLVKSALTPDQVLHEIRTFLSGSKPK
ncbi:MAG: response regulator, partial [bacterium]|nr:response regulator [bacterium]